MVFKMNNMVFRGINLLGVMLYTNPKSLRTKRLDLIRKTITSLPNKEAAAIAKFTMWFVINKRSEPPTTGE